MRFQRHGNQFPVRREECCVGKQAKEVRRILRTDRQQHETSRKVRRQCQDGHPACALEMARFVELSDLHTTRTHSAQSGDGMLLMCELMRGLDDLPEN
jgi:hypothetical protein